MRAIKIIEILMVTTWVLCGEEQATLPYSNIWPAMEAYNGNLIFTIRSEVKSDIPLMVIITSDDEPDRALSVDKNGIVILPFNASLVRANAKIIANRPKGTMILDAVVVLSPINNTTNKNGVYNLNEVIEACRNMAINAKKVAALMNGAGVRKVERIITNSNNSISYTVATRINGVIQSEIPSKDGRIEIEIPWDKEIRSFEVQVNPIDTELSFYTQLGK